MTDTTLGQRIAEGRKKLGLSQEAFGDRLGVSRQAASKWESDAAVPEIDKLITMSKLFGVSIGWLLGVEDPESPVETALTEEQLTAVTELLCRYPTPCPERKSRKWLVAACAVGMTVNLALGTLGLFLPKNEIVPQTDDTALQEQIDSLTEQNLQLQSQVVELTTQQSEKEQFLNKILDEQNKEIDALRLQMEKAETTPDNDGESVLPEQIQPANDLLDSWTLSPKIDTAMGTVALRFSGFTEKEAAEARLVAILGGHEMASKICERTSTGYSAEMQLPCVDGYTYYFMLLHEDGTRQQTELTGHGLSFLSTGMQPGFTFLTRDSLPAGNGSRSFWIYSPRIVLDAPGLIPESVQCQWSGLRIVYYHNDIAVAQKDLTEELEGISMYDRRLAFDLYTISFDFADTAEGGSHSLRLEGSVTANGLEHTFSLPIGDWVMRSGKLVDALVEK